MAYSVLENFDNNNNLSEESKNAIEKISVDSSASTKQKKHR